MERLIEHAGEAYPHFESTRGQEDIAAARVAVRAMRERKKMSSTVHHIEYTHSEDGKHYRHDFGPGVTMFALGNGDILLTHATKKLWEDFK
jgi:hypothetical protein